MIKYLKKSAHVLVALTFIWFAYVQLNDSDAFHWIFIYGIVAVIAIGAFIHWPIRRVALSFFILLLFVTLFKINLLTSWLDAGRPSFIDYEKTDIEAVENIREFLGLCISLFVLAVYAFFK